MESYKPELSTTTSGTSSIHSTVFNPAFNALSSERDAHEDQLVCVDLDGVIANWGSKIIGVLKDNGYIYDASGQVQHRHPRIIMEEGYHFYKCFYKKTFSGCNFPEYSQCTMEDLQRIWNSEVTNGYGGYATLSVLKTPLIEQIRSMLAFDDGKVRKVKLLFLSTTLCEDKLSVIQQKSEWLFNQFFCKEETNRDYLAVDFLGLVMPKGVASKADALADFCLRFGIGHNQSPILIDDQSKNFIGFPSSKQNRWLVIRGWNAKDRSEPTGNLTVISDEQCVRSLQRLCRDPAQPEPAPPQKTHEAPVDEAPPNKTSPNHYQMANGAQVIDITQELMFAEGNVVKYVSRAGRKGGESRLDDLCKAKYYLDLAIRRAEAGK